MGSGWHWGRLSYRAAMRVNMAKTAEAKRAKSELAAVVDIPALLGGLQVRRVPFASVFTDPANVRKHNTKNLDAIKSSLRQFGQVEPLVVQKSTGKVVGGNGRLAAMQELGWLEADIVEVELSDTQATALGIALNRTAELAEWDFENLGKLLQSLQAEGYDPATIGWDAGDLSNLLAADWTPPELEEGLGNEDPRGKEGGLKLTADQWAAFNQAADRVRGISGDDAIEDGRCLELLCRDYLERHTSE